MVQYPAIRQIRQYNMFDYKSVKDREVLERAANQKYDQAERLRKEGKTVEARKLAEEVLGSIPTHRRAKELLDQLTAPAPAPGTAPAAAPPGAPPAAAAPAAPPGQPAR
jgi:type II secretory pathway component HofQ